MKISKGSIIKLADGKEYLVINGKKIEKDFCLVSLINTDKKAPVEMRVFEMGMINNKPTVMPYTGSDHDAILQQLIK